MIEGKVQATAFFAAEGGIDNQGRNRGEIAQLQQVDRDLEVPIKLADFALQIAQARGGALQPFFRTAQCRRNPTSSVGFRPSCDK